MEKEPGKEKIELIPDVTVDKSLKSYADHPYFVKKAEASQKTLEKHGFPKEILDRVKKDQENSEQK